MQFVFACKDCTPCDLQIMAEQKHEVPELMCHIGANAEVEDLFWLLTKAELEMLLSIEYRVELSLMEADAPDDWQPPQLTAEKLD